MSQSSGRVYIGIDPGANGAVVAMSDLETTSCSTELTEAWEFLCRFIGTDVIALIEQQTPRPTNIPQRQPGGKVVWKQTILASTCILYGSYMELRAMLACAAIQFSDCPPKRWQGEFDLYKVKGERDGPWKNRLKSKAAELFPRLRVTLANADALLLAEYCRRVNSGGSTDASIDQGSR